MHIASLLPSATEICYALGLGPELVSVTHECDYPPAALRKPAVTSSAIEGHDKDSAQIHQLIEGQLHSGSSIYHLDFERLRQLQPDLILTQELCPVCAVSYPEVERAARLLPGQVSVISLEPNSLEDILTNMLMVGQATNREGEAQKVVGRLRGRIEQVTTTAKKASTPKVFCLEWLDPPFAAGHWVPEMVSLAGGFEGLGPLGEDSKVIPWEEVIDYRPEIIVLMPCGFNLSRTVRETRRTSLPSGWSELPSVKEGHVYAVNGSAYFNRPGPRIVDGLEILAYIFHPELFDLAPKLKRSVKRMG